MSVRLLVGSVCWLEGALRYAQLSVWIRRGRRDSDDLWLRN